MTTPLRVPTRRGSDSFIPSLCLGTRTCSFQGDSGDAKTPLHLNLGLSISDGYAWPWARHPLLLPEDCSLSRRRMTTTKEGVPMPRSSLLQLEIVKCSARL